jgi:hypothetical protein
MLILSAWKQTPYYDPTNPNQIVREAMVGTGGDRGYASFYWNQVPVDNVEMLSPSGAISGALGAGLEDPFKLAAIGIGVSAVTGAIAFFATRRRRRRR